MAYKGSESQKIGRIWDLKGKDEWRENLSEGFDSLLEECQVHAIRRIGESLMTDETELKVIGDYSPQFGGAHYADGQGPFEFDIVAALKESEQSEELNLQHSALQVRHKYTGPIGVRVRLPNQGPFKCLTVGGGGTGKTIYVKRKLMGEFEKKYEPTMGMHKHMLEFPTKQGSTQFLCVDTPGHEKPGTLRDSYYEGADCCIIFYDITAKQTQKDVSMWHEDVHRVCGDIPMVACGNKVDLKKRQVKTKKVTFHMKKKLQYYEISAKSGYNLDSPFQYLAEKLAA